MSYASFDPNASTGGPKSEEKYREWELQPQNEYRFELAPNTSIGIKVRGCRGVNVRLNLLHRRIRVYQLVDGYAECFGIELATGISYLFGGECKAVIYTHSGCTLEMSFPFDAGPSLQNLTISPLTYMGSPQQNTPRKRRPWATINLQASYSSRCEFFHWRLQTEHLWMG